MRSVLNLSCTFYLTILAACSGTSITNNIVGSAGSTNAGTAGMLGGSTTTAGAQSTGGSKSVGGSSTFAGSLATTLGGSSVAGGAKSSGGSAAIGGSNATGGLTATGGGTGITGGISSTGGISPTGGSTSIAAGGAMTSGGTSASAGKPSTGGASNTGGITSTGATTSTGTGGSPVGGSSGTGGTAGAAGSTSTQTLCSGSYVDLQTSDANCGACNYACVHGRHCSTGLCSPAWQPLSTINAPAARTRHAAGFVSGKYIIFGGALSYTGVGISSSAAYDVANDTWSNLTPLNVARCSHQAVSTGTTILTFGGLSDCSNGAATGPGLEQFTPNTSVGSWSVIAITNEPTPRYIFATVWTGSSMFLYGGGGSSSPATNSGAIFDPSGPSWSDASCSLANSQRGGGFSAFVDGALIKLWGGNTGSAYGNAPAGIAYDLSSKTWAPWVIPVDAPAKLAYRSADDGRRIYYLLATNDVTIYDRKASTWLADDTSAMPPGFCTEAPPVWTGSEMVAWSGSCGSTPVTVGGRYQPPAPPN